MADAIGFFFKAGGPETGGTNALTDKVSGATRVDASHKFTLPQLNTVYTGYYAAIDDVTGEDAGKDSTAGITVNAPAGTLVCATAGGTFGASASLVAAKGAFQPVFLKRTGIAAATPDLEFAGGVSFTTGTRPAQVGTITLTPGDASLVADCADVSGASGYEWDISTSNTFATNTRSTTATSAKTFTSLTNGTTYYVRCRAYDSNGVGAFSATANGAPEAAHTDDFAAAELNTTSLWDLQLNTGATYSQSGGVLTLDSDATTEGFLLYRKTKLTLNTAKTYKWKIKADSTHAWNGLYLFMLEDINAPRGPANSSTAPNHGRLTSTTNGTTNNPSRIDLYIDYNSGSPTATLSRSTTATTTTSRFWNQSGSTWGTSAPSVTGLAADTYYVVEFGTRVSGVNEWRVQLKSADESTTIIDSGWQNYSGISTFANTSGPFLVLAADWYDNTWTSRAVLDWYNEV